MNTKQQRLIDFLNECYTWKLEYVNNNDDFINGYDYILEGTIDLDKAKRNLDCSGISDDTLKKIILDNYTLERASYNYPENALSFVNIDEIEDQVSGISEGDIPCVFKDLTQNMSENELQEITRMFDYTLKGDCIYFQPDFSSVQLVVDYDVLQNEVDKLTVSN